MQYYGFTSKFSTQDGKQAELAKILVQAADLLQSNPACLAYVVSHETSSGSVIVNEIWENKQSHDDSLSSDDVKHLIASAVPLLSGRPEIIAETTIVGGKGLPGN